MHTNALIHETSPYLLQHAHNPVNWYPWSDAALNKAKEENKMLIISVGYAACHWCHVMEHESYEDAAVAKIMNENFISIKVDREERPDVDQVYMNAAYLISGNGGWPLNALAMPDGKPFYAGTYFPKDRWIQVLEYFTALYKNDRFQLGEQAELVAKGINDIENVPKNNKATSVSIATLDAIFLNLQPRIDYEKGGTKGSIKFPMPSVWEFLLQYSYFTKNEKALQAVNITLQQMAKGGIYDQVGGGFSRYSTDPNWHAPHFEKMLYDNAQLVSLYSHAFQVTSDPLYKEIVYETIAFIQRELTSAEGAFYSSLDADSKGEEGKFYVWSHDEIKNILGSDAAIFSDYYGIESNGNWEHNKNIPDQNEGYKKILEKYNFTAEQLDNIIEKLKLKVLTERNRRVRPATDDKILTSWNALMIKGLVDAYAAFGESDFLIMAETNVEFLLRNVSTKENGLYRNYKNGKATIPAFLDDYAFLISALINCYQASFKEEYLNKAKDLTIYTEQHFFDKASGMFFYTDDQHSNLIARKMEITDNVIPSSNSEMAKNFLLLSIYFENESYAEKCDQLIKNVLDDVEKNVNYYSNWAQVIALQIKPLYEIAIVGNEWQQRLSAFHKEYLPTAVFFGGATEGSLSLLQNKLIDGKTMIYVCENRTCQKPVESTDEALQLIK